MLENRETMPQMFPELFTKLKVQPVSSYPQTLRRSLAYCAPEGARNWWKSMICGLRTDALRCARQDSQILASAISDRLPQCSIGSIFQDGLHEFLGDFLKDTPRLAGLIEQDFRFYA